MAAPRDLFEAALAAEGVTGTYADIARSIYMQESGGGKNTKTSNAGAMGGMQIVPSTFNSVADKGWDIKDPMHNARAGIRYVGEMFKRAGGDPVLTAAGYYGGPGGLDKARKGVAVSDPRNPKAPNTLQYGQQVASRLPSQPVPAPVPEVAAAPTPTTVRYADVAPPPVVESVPVGNQVSAPVSEPVVEAPQWAAMQQAMPVEPVKVANLDYAQMFRQGQEAMPPPQVNMKAFRPFGKWGGRV